MSALKQKSFFRKNRFWFLIKKQWFEIGNEYNMQLGTLNRGERLFLDNKQHNQLLEGIVGNRSFCRN